MASAMPCHNYALACIVTIVHTARVNWDVDLHDDFFVEYGALHKDVQDELLACIVLLEQFGPQLGRPRGDSSTIHATPI